METIIKIQKYNTDKAQQVHSSLKKIEQEAVVLMKLKAEKLEKISDDGQGVLLIITSEGEFISNGVSLYKGNYEDYRWNNGRLAIRIAKDRKSSIIIAPPGKEIFSADHDFNWDFIRGKLLIEEKRGLFVDGKLLLPHEEYESWKTVRWRLFIKTYVGGVYEIFLPEER